MSQAVFSPNLTKKFQWEVSQIAKKKLPIAILYFLGGLSLHLNHLKNGKEKNITRMWELLKNSNSV